MARKYASHLPQVAVHLETPSVARVYDYYLGGSNNWTVDREFGRQVLDRYPLMRHIAFIHRQFLNRVVRHLSARGIDQFLDVGSGVPGHGSTHRVADGFAVEGRSRPTSRVIYVDNDPIAVAHGEMLLNDYGDPRRHVILEGDLRDPDNLWQQVGDTGLFDPDRPVALLLIAVLHLQQPDIEGTEIGPESVYRLRAHLPEGSYVALSHATNDCVAPEVSAALDGLVSMYNTPGSGGPVTWRSRKQISGLLDDLTMLDPGWTLATDWHPDDGGSDDQYWTIPPSSAQAVWAGVGRIPTG